nr:3'-5' exonuclease [Bifidobacterium miconis]
MLLLDKGSYYGILHRIAYPSNKAPSFSPLPGELSEHVGVLRAFFDQFESLRAFAATHPIDELLWRIYTQTGWYDYCGRLSDGHQRQANLAQLCVKARTFAGTEARGIPAFLKAVEQWQANGNKDVNAEAVTLSTKDAVHMTTIHQAKGLQWKAVILADATSATYDAKNLPRFVTVQKPGDPEHGVAACRIADERAQSVVDTFQRRYLAGIVKRQAIEEQLRLLYVALTRPERKLIIAGIGKDDFNTLLTEVQERTQAFRPDGSVAADDVMNGNQYVTWILQALHAASLHAGEQGAEDFKMIPAETGEDGGSMAFGFLPISDGLAQDTTAGNASGRRIVLIRDLEDVRVPSRQDDEQGCSERAIAAKRPSPEGFASVDERVPDGQRRPLTLNASGIRNWAQAMAQDGLDDDDVSSSASGGTIVQDNADERSWRFSAYPLPDFMTGLGAGPSAAEIGTGVHNVLEQFDWSTPAESAACAAQLRAVIHRLAAARIISDAAAREIEHGPLFDGMMWFVCPGDGMLGGGASLADGIRAHRDRLYREAPFSLLLDDRELRGIAATGGLSVSGTEGADSAGAAARGGVTGDGVIVRGVIDGYYVDDATRSIVLFDYKTDAMRDDGDSGIARWMRRLHDDYCGQQALYAKALQQLYPKYTVTERWLVGLVGHRFIDVSDTGISG